MINNTGVGTRINEIRLSKGLTMKDFGEKIDSKVTKGTVNNWEKGRARPRKDRLKKIAELGQVSVNYILYGESKELNQELYEYLKEKLDQYIFTYNSPRYNSEVLEEYGNKMILKYKDYTFEDFSSEENNPYSPATLDSYLKYKQDLWDKISYDLSIMHHVTESVHEENYEMEQGNSNLLNVIGMLFTERIEEDLYYLLKDLNDKNPGEEKQYIKNELTPILDDAVEKVLTSIEKYKNK